MNEWRYMKDREFKNGRNYLGASDAPTIAGINLYQTPLELWEIFTGRKEGFKGNNLTKWGHIQEVNILAEYVYKMTGSKEHKNDFITSRIWGEESIGDYHSWTEAVYPENNRILSHADLLDLSGDIPVIIQAKNTGEFAAATRKKDINKGYDKNDTSSNGIPLSVYFQEQIELLTYGIPRAWVAVLIGGNDWRLYGEIEYNKKTVEKLLALYIKFLWHVDKDIPPTPKTWGDIQKLYPNFKKNTKAVVSDDAELECRQMLEEHFKINLKIKDLESRKNDIKNAMGLYIGNNNYLQTPDGLTLASASEIKGRESVSVSSLKKEPELYKKITEAGLITQSEGYRQLYIKGTPAGNIVTYTLLTTEDGSNWNRSRKKYNSDEKKSVTALLKSLKMDYQWEKN